MLPFFNSLIIMFNPGDKVRRVDRISSSWKNYCDRFHLKYDQVLEVSYCDAHDISILEMNNESWHTVYFELVEAKELKDEYSVY